jgi:hypothetical protein
MASNDAPKRRQPALQFILERLDPVLYHLSAVAHLAEVAVEGRVILGVCHGEAAARQWRSLI